jgi:hypothetical protein
MGKHRLDDGKEILETSELVRWIKNLYAKYGDQIADDPAGLVHLPELREELTMHANRGTFEANRGRHRYSTYEIAKMRGVSRQMTIKMIRDGERAYAAWWARKGAGHVMYSLPREREFRAARMRAADVPDRTGSHRERSA